MSKLIRLCLTLLATLSAALALPASAKQPPTRPALWKLSDADTTIYLFGTVHLLPRGLQWYEGKVAAAFNRSDEFVSEIADVDPARMAAAAKIAILPANTSLRAMLQPAERAMLESALAGQGEPLDKLDRFEPWYAAIYLSTAPLLNTGYDPAHGVEATLEAHAKRAGRTHVGLETIEQQLGLFDSLPAEVQRKYLSQIAAQSHTIRGEIASIIEQWRSGNAEKLAELMNAEEDDPVLVATLITNRNRAWAEWVKARMDKPGTVFLAVGAGHLAGPGSLQDQLRTLGFTATRVQ